MELLLSLDIDETDTRLLTSLYWNQTAAVRCDTEIINSMCIKQGVRQGCVALPHLFALYREMIMREIDELDGFKLEVVFNNPRYADQTVLLVESEEQLQQLINVVITESERKGLYLNSAVFHHGILKCKNEPYMQHHRPGKRSRAGPVLRLHGMSIHL